MNLFNRAAFPLNPATGRRNKNGLSERVGVPGGLSACSKVTLPAELRPGSAALKSISTRTEPVKYSLGPLAEGYFPTLWMFIVCPFNFPTHRG